jgi:hypothetical protein
MDFASIADRCDDPAVGKVVLDAIVALFERDLDLLRMGVKEETITCHLARYLYPYFPDLHIDVEYSLMGDAPKAVTYDERPQRVYPDIIVHIRNNRAKGIPNAAANLLAIEVKKDTNLEETERDIRKLRAYRRELEYRHALFLRFGTGEAAGTVIECEWVDA